MVEVVVGALVRDGRVLLGHRGPDKQAYPGVWELPGGVVEAGESELVALRRELGEELGVEIDLASTSLLSRLRVSPAGDPVRLSAWLVRRWRGAPANLAPEEHLAIGWFGVEEMPPLVHPTVQDALARAVAKNSGRGA